MSFLSFVLLTLANDPSMLSLLMAHKFAVGAVVYALFSSIVDGMPAPTPNSGAAYRWLYGSMHALALNLCTAVAVLFPRFALLLSRAPSQAGHESSTGKVLQMPSPMSEDPSKPA